MVPSFQLLPRTHPSPPLPSQESLDPGRKVLGSSAQGRSLAWELGHQEPWVCTTSCRPPVRWLRARCFSRSPEFPHEQNEWAGENVLRGPGLLELTSPAPRSVGLQKHLAQHPTSSGAAVSSSPEPGPGPAWGQEQQEAQGRMALRNPGTGPSPRARAPLQRKEGQGRSCKTDLGCCTEVGTNGRCYCVRLRDEGETERAMVGGT